MDSSLLRERELFKRKALSNPTVEKRPSTTPLDDQRHHKKRKIDDPKLITKTQTFSAKHQNFAVLAKIVQHLRTAYLQGKKNPLTLEEILQETEQTDINPNEKSWLRDTALKGNPKVKATKEKFMFKPMYKLEDRKSLAKLLLSHDLKGLGGILMDDVVESLPNAENILKVLDSHKRIKVITRSSDKKKILFHCDQEAPLDIDDEFKKLWKTTTVEALGENKIADYLNNQGIASMQGEGFKKPVILKKKKGEGKRRKPKDNAHLEGILETYEDNSLTNKAQ